MKFIIFPIWKDAPERRHQRASVQLEQMIAEVAVPGGFQVLIFLILRT